MKPPFKMIIETDLEQWRYDTFWIKEPETIEWIKSFKDGDIFFDVGCNIGIYSLYCSAIHSDMTIYAFEPMLKNFSRLCENIKFNNFFNIIPIYAGITNDNILLDKRIRFASLITDSTAIGSSGGQLINNNKSIQLMSFSLNDFCLLTGKYPNYIKIDVDGLEFDIFVGMQNLLTNGILKSCLIEINNEVIFDCTKKEIIQAEFVRNHFTYENEPLNYIPNHSRYRRQKEEDNTAENVIFVRK